MASYSVTKESPYESVFGHARTWATENPQRPLFLFALVDAGQDKLTWERLSRLSTNKLSLLNTEDSAADAFSPQLLDFGVVFESNTPLETALSARNPTTAFTLLCSTLSSTDLHRHLAQFVEVRLSGNMEMLLAFWDPAILATLVGQKEDDSLHVPGPVLAVEQMQAFLSPIVAWWYCDRESRWHRIDPPTTDAGHNLDEQRLSLTQQQEDMLVEASVPDQILYHLELNQPHLFDTDKTHAMRYGFVKAVLGPARQLGLTGMRDLVNFTALCLIYRRRMHTDPAIARLLDQVQSKAITLDQALPLMPE